ncbi:hypothetical protein BgiMline_001377 [Biomphalaria glabrata]|nr:hypothetical protein BgiBS90_009830 [Biomphalaria glabrata]
MDDLSAPVSGNLTQRSLSIYTIAIKTVSLLLTMYITQNEMTTFMGKKHNIFKAKMTIAMNEITIFEDGMTTIKDEMTIFVEEMITFEDNDHI